MPFHILCYRYDVHLLYFLVSFCLAMSLGTKNLKWNFGYFILWMYRLVFCHLVLARWLLGFLPTCNSGRKRKWCVCQRTINFLEVSTVHPVMSLHLSLCHIPTYEEYDTVFSFGWSFAATYQEICQYESGRNGHCIDSLTLPTSPCS